MTKTVQKIPAKTLEWGNASEKELTWKEAKEWCKQQGDGWRMPTRIELLQAYEDNWSSTEVSGTAGSNYKPNAYCVWCVKVCDTAKKLK